MSKNLKIVLYDGTAVNLSDATYSHDFVVLCQDRAAFFDAWDKFTPENLVSVQITENDNVIQVLTDVVLSGTQAVYNPDGTITAHFYCTVGAYAPITQDEPEPDPEPEEEESE